ncbi:liprin-beta-2 [Parasteatoda tepidariorum]|uniref:liprin-beta-2 n=1 Tax=Parasteatoda tepidariorum TaxID=114398 RepID=UPI001C72778D|nr:liprin-beta-2 isoform X1 [Parasteatoda tepidariorum]
MQQRWAPPPPPPRDPSGIHSIVESHRHHHPPDDEEAMSSDSSDPKRRSSYENIQAHERFLPNKPPPPVITRRSRDSSLHRSTPSPSLRPPCRLSSPRDPCWSDTLSDDACSEPVRRRPGSRASSRIHHRGPTLDCPASTWGHPSSPCCVPYHWCGAAHFMHSGNEVGFECDDLEQRISQLEIEKQQLTLQVNVLSDQVEAQNEKVEELEYSLSKSKEQLDHSETLLRKEMSTRSTIENSKLDLMAQISALRIRLASVENEKRETEERNCKLENELILTCACLAEKETELSTFKARLARSGATTPLPDNNNSEFEKLRGALSSVMALNDEKEREIQEMKTSFNRYRKLQELVLSNSSHEKNDSSHRSVEDSFLSTILSSSFYDFSLSEKPPPVPRQNENHRLSPLFTPIRGGSPFGGGEVACRYSGSSENVNPSAPQKTPPLKRFYSTLPRPHQSDILKQFVKPVPEISTPRITVGTSHSVHNLHHSNFDAPRTFRPKPSGVSFGKGLLRMRLGKRCSSAPELAPEISETSPVSPPQNRSCRRTSSPIHPPKEKHKGLRKIFGKVRRSGSENLNSSAAELKRGGIRATAGPRLGWSEKPMFGNNSFKKTSFVEWDNNMICDWLISIGLSMYIQDCKKWGKNGEQLLKATTTEFEKELNIKNPLHRKKLLLALKGSKEMAGEEVEPAEKIDYQWVVRWLDDIGLPQYKDAFFEARMDGRMLHHLTLDDLSHLKVTNLLHHISIKTGIQVLRENNFDPLCLRRRSLPDDCPPNDVSRWTNHRVMEWLRNVDLSEYAPNLRGSGVHGGLMMYEHRFNADLMATLLNIPPSKTLLRRHLTTQFKLVVGPDTIQKKRESETRPDFVPLSPSAKFKNVKRGGPFSLGRKRNKVEYVCPLNFDLGSSLLMLNDNRTEEEKFLMKEMVLKNETVLENMPASNV